jgi:hypothetical protein
MRYFLVVAGLALSAWSLPAQIHPEARRAQEEHWRAHPEHPDKLVRLWHERFFHGAPAEPWIARWVDELHRGVEPCLAVAHMLATQEYFARCGNKLEVYVRTMFLEVVGRAPTPQEYDFWLRRFYHEDRATVAYDLMTRYPPAWVMEETPPAEAYEYRAPIVPYRR